MGFEDEIRGATRRIHDFVGRDVLVVTREKTGTDDRNNPIFEESSVQTTAEFVPSGSPNASNEIYGLDVDVDTVIYVPDTVAVSDGGNENDATRIVDQHGDGTYRVNEVHRQANTGLYELYCTKE